MNDLERQVRDTLFRHQDDAPRFDISDARGTARRTRRRQARNVAIGAIGAAVVIVAFAGLGGLVRADRSPTVLDTPSPSQTSIPTPGPDDAEVHGWPGPTRNPAGVYSWDGSPDRSFPDRTTAGMHNGYSPGSGDVYVVFKGVPGQLIPHRGQRAVSVAGYEGSYRRFIVEDGPWRSIAEGGPYEEWMMDIQGTTVTVLLVAAPGARETELAEAHGIIGSIRMEPQDNDLGFRLNFTLATNTWDSG